MDNNFPKGKRSAMEEELIRGRELANLLLQVLVDKSNIHDGNKEQGAKMVFPVFVEDLVQKVLRSFTNTLLLMNSNDCSKREIRDEGNTSKNSTPKALKTKNRRGCYKRKSSAPTWEKDSSILIDDGYAWRKYGQKLTSNAKYLRSYYRCTHKYDEGCEAIKQVQRIEDHPPLYRTTYYGHHTCKNSFNNDPEIILEPVLSSCLNSSTLILNFNCNYPGKQQNLFSSSLVTSMKEESVAQDDHEIIIAQNQLSSPENDLILFDDNNGVYFDYLRNVMMISSTQSVEFENVYGQFGF